MTHKEQNLMKVWPKLTQTDKDNLRTWARMKAKPVNEMNLPLLDITTVYEILDFLDWAVGRQNYITSEWHKRMRKLMDETYDL